MLNFQNITKSFGGQPVLREVSFSCEAGEIVCLVGANAAGKTTLLTIGAGLQKPEGGLVSAKGKIGFVPQENGLLLDLTVKENLALWYAAAGRSSRCIFAPESAEEELGLTPFGRKRTALLSGGMKKRAALACALAGDPDYLLMDEPFTALDQAGRGEIASLLQRLKKRGKGILLSSHDPAAIAMSADKLVFLREGQVREPQLLPTEGKQARYVFVMEALAKAEGLEIGH